MVEAYVLIQVEVGKAGEVAERVAALAGVTKAEHVTGPYDVIIRAGADSLDLLVRGVVTGIQVVPGVVRTLTCPIVHL